MARALLLRLASAAVSAVEIDNARNQWEDAHRRLQDARADRRRYERLMRQVEAVSEELRKRVGDTFALAELVRAYAGAERWTRDAVAAVSARARDLEDLALVEDAAFYLYARGASDYEP